MRRKANECSTFLTDLTNRCAPLFASGIVISHVFYQPASYFASKTILAAAIMLFVCSCSTKNKSVQHPLFELLPGSQTGIQFNNRVVDTKAFNIFKFRNFYNGGGVAIGDINNDGKPDIFFTSNMGENKCYINKGNWQFEDITAKAGLTSKHHWHTGVTMADVNGDGWLDIYVCNSGEIEGDDKANELYINQHNGTFIESAHEYGLDDKGLSTQAVFFDMDRDGDLDCFVLNNSPRSVESFGYNSTVRNIRDTLNGDRLYRNDNGKFVDVSDAAGIYGSAIGFGLGVTIGDVNNDGWDDMYISNDFFERDYLYINQHNGKFKEIINDAMGHISMGSMGSDMADINNDGWLDIFTTEMLPESDYRLKTTIKFDEYNIYNAKLKNDFHHQFTSNCLQLNNHNNTFSEIAQLAGVDATGWSWGALSFDFDNDGWKDIFVCNGISKDLTDQDFLEFFSNSDIRNKISSGEFGFNEILKRMPSVPIPNYAFLNQHNLHFKNVSDSFGFSTPTLSNGAAYADLDGDGDLDLVINNENMEAFVYRNHTSEKLHKHYLAVKLKGKPGNNFGTGARVSIWSKGNKQMLEQMPCRGFQSTVDNVLHFGLGDENMVDSVEVAWTDGKRELKTNIKSDTTLVLDQANAHSFSKLPDVERTIFTSLPCSSIVGNAVHTENEYNDFDVERLLPKMLSTEGPKLAVADVNGDGLEDFVMGSSFQDTMKLFLQTKEGKFIRKIEPVFGADNYFENTGLVFVDVDNDGDQDLIAAAGGNQAKQGSPYLATRLYINDGRGNFTHAGKGWPDIKINASCVAVQDINGDGLPDVFIGARNIPGAYGLPPSSVLLMNKGNGVFEDVTASMAPGLQQLGMVTDARWSDVDGDGKKELIVAGDWMPVMIFKYADAKLKIQQSIPNSSGWWNCISIADVNGDGWPDIIGGNLGRNCRIIADSLHPAKMYVSDFDKNGQTECIPVYYKSDGKAYPYHLKGELEAQLPQLKKKFLTFASYAGKSIEDVFSKEQLQEAKTLTVTTRETTVFMNDGKGNFKSYLLPVEAQLSPSFAILPFDFNNDGLTDIFIAGNFYGLKPQSGRFDANYGTILLGKKGGGFEAMPCTKTGIQIHGEVRDAKLIRTGHGPVIAVSVNNDSLRMYQLNAGASIR